MTRSIDNTPLEEIAIDRKADVPVGVQLEWALSAQIREGALLPGQQLPTLREMAQRTRLNVNTIRTVYQRLEQRGLVESQHGSGTFVAAAAREAGALGSIAAHAAHEARATGLDPREVAAALYVTPGSDHALESGSNLPQASELDRRRALRGQIATLERTIAELEADHPGVAPSPARSRRGIGPALLSVDELAQVRTGLIRRLALVQAAIDEQAEVQSQDEARASVRARAAKAKPSKDASAKKVKPKRRRTTPPAARPSPAGG